MKTKNAIFPGTGRVLRLAVVLFTAGLFSACAGTPPQQAGKPAAPAPEKRRNMPKDPKQQAYRDFMSAQVSFFRGDAESARKYLSAAIREDPGSVYLNRKMAFLLKRKKAYRKALAYALRCIDIAPGDVKNRALLADLYTLMGDEDLAVEQYEKIIAVQPENERVRLLLATILIRKRRFSEALRHLDILLERNPALTIAHYYRGRINLERRRYDEAESAYLAALRLDRTLEPALFDLGTLYQISGRSVDAVEAYENLLKLYPDNTSVRERLLNLYFKLGFTEKANRQMEEIRKHTKPGEPGRQVLGLIYLKQGKLDRSIEELKLIVTAWPDDDKTRYYLATAYEEKGDYETALIHFRRIKPASRYYISAHLHMGFILETQKRYDDAIAVLQKALALKPEESRLYLMLGSLYETRGAYKKGMAVIRKGLALDPKNIDLLFRLGVILDKSGDKTACIRQMEKVLEIDPRHADALNYIGYTYAEQGIRLDEAMALIRKALKIKPESGYIMDSLGWVYFRKGDYAKALHYLEKAAKLTPDPTIQEHLGDVYYRTKRYPEALSSYRKALAMDHPDREKIKARITDIKAILKRGN